MSSGTRKLLGLLVILGLGAPVAADVHDPLDPFDHPVTQKSTEEDPDATKSAEELILEASVLLQDERLLDGRTKLLKALQKDPTEYRAHTLLSGYYLVNVGHFRLALKYAKRALELLQEKNGAPPYLGYRVQAEHSHLLYLLSQVRLNLDDYPGALKVLDEFTSWGYVADWYSGSRAWILMKLGRLDEAIQVSKLGVLSGDEPGRSLNMLGILLSMKGERSAAVSVFRDAIAHELSLGRMGQPATPLNNVGEVYREIFDEERAESSFLRATSMPDGCEHVLPAMNLTLLYIDQLNFNAARRTVDQFESCVAQYPLRNGEEHRAFVALARGRIALHTGHYDEALAQLERSLADRQWFGKIGTNLGDLQAAAQLSLVHALQAKNAALRFSQLSSWGEWFQALRDRARNAVQAWWALRRARQILMEDLNDFEDLKVRNTDSMLEYPSLGIILRDVPAALLEKRLTREQDREERKEAAIYYEIYYAENLLARGRTKEALLFLEQIMNRARPIQDNLLRLRAILLAMTAYRVGSPDYNALAAQAFNLSRPSLRTAGLPLPVNFRDADSEVTTALSKVGFYLDNSQNHQYRIDFDRYPDEIILHFSSTVPKMVDLKVRGADLMETVNKLADEAFTIDPK